MWLLLLHTSLSLATLVVLLWGVGEYIRLRRQIRKLILLYTKPPRMQMDDLIDGLLAEETAAAGAAVGPTQPGPTSAAQREKLATIAAGGQARQYLGKAWSVEEIDALGDDEVEKLYARYEARLGAAMTKTLGRAALQLYTAARVCCCRFLPRTKSRSWKILRVWPIGCTARAQNLRRGR